VSEPGDEDETGLNQFVATAVAEKVSVLRTAQYFVERKGRTDWSGFDRLMSPKGGEAPEAGDKIPEGFEGRAER
jgi:hypothetical protein